MLTTYDSNNRTIRAIMQAYSELINLVTNTYVRLLLVLPNLSDEYLVLPG